MAKVRVAVFGTVGKSVLIETGLESRIAALETAITHVGGVTAHNQLTGLTVGDDHTQYAMNAAAETISAPWNFAAIPSIEGTILDEYIQDSIGLELRNSASIYLEYSDYGGTDGKISAHLNNEYVEDLIGAMLTDSPTIDFSYGDTAGDISAAVKTDHAYVWSALHTFNAKILANHIDIGEADVMIVNGVTVDAQVQNNSDTMAAFEAHTHSNIAAVPSAYYGARGRGTEAAPAIVQNGDYLMRLAAVGFDGVDYAFGAAIDFIVSATPGSNDMPTDIVFSTAADGSQTLVEHFRITAGGTGVFSGAVTAASFNTFTGFANPSASLGLAAVNGSAATAMRSDGAPALDQGIAPTWTGLHSFSGSGIVAKIVGDTAQFRFVNGAAGVYGFFGTEKAWQGSGTDVTDFVFASGTGGILFHTSGQTTNILNLQAASIAFGNTTDNPTFSFLGTGELTIGGAVTFNKANPAWFLNDTGAAADNRLWRHQASAGTYAFVTLDDAVTTSKVIFAAARTGNAVAGIDFGNATDNPTYAFQGTGRTTFGGVARLKGYTVGTLPAGTAGDTAFVTDALTPVFGAAVVGGGAVTVPVYYTGAAWFVG